MLKNDVIIPGNQWPIDDTTEKKRLHRIHENTLLFRGKLHKIQSMINWHERVTSNWTSRPIPALVAANFYKPITLLCADLLYGEQGELMGAKCTNDKAKEGLKNIIENNRFNALAYEVGGLAASYRKNGLFSVAYNDITKRVEITAQPANLWFPVVSQSQVKKIEKDIIAWPEKHGDKYYLRKQVHTPGTVENYVYELNNSMFDLNDKNSIAVVRDGRIGRQVKLDSIGVTVPEITDTRIDRSLIISFPNWGVDDDIYGIDDFEDLDCLIIELAVMLSRNSMVLGKHTDPNMYGPASALQYDEKTGQYTIKGGGTFYPVEEGEQPPGYLTWDGRLEAAEKQIDRLIELIFYISETSPAAFGMDKVSSTESGTALKKRLMRTIAKTNRKKLYADPAIRDTLEIAMMMDTEWAGGKYEVERPHIDWQDGLPDDDLEQVQIVGQRVKDGTLSQLQAIMILDKCDEQTAQKELDRIQKEKDAALPAWGRSQFGQSGNNQPPQNPFGQGGNTQGNNNQR